MGTKTSKTSVPTAATSAQPKMTIEKDFDKESSKAAKAMHKDFDFKPKATGKNASNKPAEKHAPKASNKAAEKHASKPSNKPAEKHAPTASNKPAEKHAPKASNKPAEKNAPTASN